MRLSFVKFLVPLLSLALICLVANQVNGQTAEELFRNGVASYQKNQLDQARDQFTQLLKLSPYNVEALFNLGLTELKAKNEGLALGLWRKALALDPTNSQVRDAILYAENNLAQRSAPRGADFFESFRNSLLVGAPLSSFLIINLILLAFAGWLLIRYYARRRSAIENDLPSPSAPVIGSLFAGLFLISTLLVAAKLYDLSIVRATIVSDRVEVRTSPGEDGTTLFELFEGLEVVVRQSSGEWTQVNYPGGLTGWVPTSSLFVQSSER